MNRIITITLLSAALMMAGCDSLRFAPGQVQKQNAWLHNWTTQAAAETARNENASQELRGLTGLAAAQSKAFINYFGLPDEPQMPTAREMLSEETAQIAIDAQIKAAQRPDLWQAADGLFETAIAIAGLIGGVYGTRAAAFLKTAAAKTKALREIIAANETLRKSDAQINQQFKQAHAGQSSQTRQLVSEIKNSL